MQAFSMIKVQTLRLRGLCVPSLLALVACSGAPTADSTAPSEPAAAGEPAAPVEPSPQGQGKPSSKALLDKALANARRSMDLRLFQDARNEAAFALELDNANEEARDILRRCNEILGTTPSTTGARADDQWRITVIAAERERASIEHELDLGDALSQQGQYGRALEHYEAALSMLKFSIYIQPNDALRKSAESKAKAAQEAKAKAESDALLAQKAQSQQELERVAREQAEARAGKVQRLLEDANSRFQNGLYEEAVTRVDQALLLDPANPTALALRDLADRARHGSAIELHRERFKDEWNKTFLELQSSNIPQSQTVVFDPARWAVVSQRKPASYTPPAELENPETRAIIAKLDSTVTSHNFASATVEDWSSYYAQVTGITFWVSPGVKDMGAEATTLTDFKLPNMSVSAALKVIKAQTGVAWKVEDGMVVLVTPEQAIGALYLAQYKVSDLVTGVKGRPGPDLKLKDPQDDSALFGVDDSEPAPAVVDDSRLRDLLTSTVAPGKWDGQPFTMNYQNGVLFVRADAETQEKINRLLNDLRRHVGIQVDIESRFLKVEDSFLEDVGVDLRGLGNQAAQGLPGRGLEKHGLRQNAGFDDFGQRQQQNPATPGLIGTGTEPGVFYDDGGDGDYMARLEHLYDSTLGGRNGGLDNSGGLSLQYAFLDDTEVEIVMRAVSKQQRSEQIDAPRLLVYNNTRASMSFLRNISYIKDFEVEIAQAAAVANPVIGVVHDGLALDVRPVVDADLKFITMELRPTVMSLQLPIPTFTTTLGVGQPISIQLPSVTLQRVRTTVTMPDGGTMMLGGMKLVERQHLESGVPVLKDLPGLSFLFSRKGNSTMNRKILILIRAKIVLMEEMEPETIRMPDGSLLSAR
ncbi:MAG: hypothetical protein Fur0037_25670 [Planctomycetota bacterium]